MSRRGTAAVGTRVRMLFLAAFSILCLVTILVQLWFLWGFSRELRQGRKTIGVLIRVVSVNDLPAENLGQKINNIIEFPPAQGRAVRPGAARRSRHAFGTVVPFEGLVILMGSRGKLIDASTSFSGELERPWCGKPVTRAEISGELAVQPSIYLPCNRVK